MAVFQGDDFNRLDWRLLQNGAVSLYWRLSILDQDVEWLESHEYVVHKFDCSNWNSAGDFHDIISKVLRFPGYYGEHRGV